MKRTLLIPALLFGSSAVGQSLLPETPFSGAYGATIGAGGVMGWERGMGANPSAGGSRGLGALAAGFSPFGLQGLTVAEAGMNFEGNRLGGMLSYRGVRAEGIGSASAWEWRQSARLGKGWRTGASLGFREDEGWSFMTQRAISAGFGLLWRGFPFLGLGMVWEGRPLDGSAGSHFGLGADAGWTFRAGPGFRVCGEGMADSKGKWEWKFGAGLRLHQALSVYGGLSPESHTWALGARFGLGRWEGFHALRRHAFLGVTSLQGLRWSQSH